MLKSNVERTRYSINRKSLGLTMSISLDFKDVSIVRHKSCTYSYMSERRSFTVFRDRGSSLEFGDFSVKMPQKDKPLYVYKNNTP